MWVHFEHRRLRLRSNSHDILESLIHRKRIEIVYRRPLLVYFNYVGIENRNELI